MESNLFRQIDEIEKNKSGVGEGDDIESILKYLEDKNKKKDNSKLPLISTKQKFYKYIDKQQWRHIKNNPQAYEQKNNYRNQ